MSGRLRLRKAARGEGRWPLATSSMTWTKWVRVNSRVYWSSATSSKSSSRGVPSMIQSNAMRVMTAAGGAFDKGVENGGQDQQSLLGRRIESSVTKEVTLEDLRMFTGVAEPTTLKDRPVRLRT